MSLPESMALYRGYPSIVEIHVDNGGEGTYKLVGNNCTVKASTEPNKFIVNPGSGKKVVLNVIDQSDSSHLLQRFELLVLHLPNPVLFFGASRSGTKASKRGRVLFAKYPPEIPLTAKFLVVKWRIEVEGTAFNGTGYHLSDEANAFLETLESGAILSAIVHVKGPDGIVRSMGAAWTF